METCISNFPLCCPYPRRAHDRPLSRGEVASSISPSPCKASEFTLTKAFKRAGYRTGYVGKWHLNGDHDQRFQFIPAGPKRVEIDDWHIWEDTNDHYHSYTFHPDTGEKHRHCKQWAPVDMTDQTIGLLEGYAKKPDEPFFLMLSYNPPHPPFDPPSNDREQNPVNAQKYRPNTRVGAGGPAFLKSTDQFHHAMQGYLGGISGIDAEFGRLMAALDRLGLAEDTIVFFTSDHGEMMGSQGKGGKILPYDESNHVPFFARYPGVTPKGASSEALFGAIDIYPTVCGMAGVPVPPSCSGKDYSDVLKGKSKKGADRVFLQGAPGRDNGSGEADTRDKAFAIDHAQHAPLYYRGIRTDQYTYAVREGGRWLLFDNKVDPYQMKNLAGDKAHKAVMEGFDVELKAWIKKTGDKFQFPANPESLSTEDAGEGPGEGI